MARRKKSRSGADALADMDRLAAAARPGRAEILDSDVVVGVDPGFSGGIVVVTAGGVPLRGIAMPTIKVKGGNELDVHAIRDLFRAVAEHHNLRLVAVEKVHAMPRDSTPSAFRFGFYYGKVCAVAECLDLPIELVTPQAWQKQVLAGTQQKGKQDAIAFARRRFPTLSLRASALCRTDHDGIADAACIAEWARRRVFGG